MEAYLIICLMWTIFAVIMNYIRTPHPSLNDTFMTIVLNMFLMPIAVLMAIYIEIKGKKFFFDKDDK